MLLVLHGNHELSWEFKVCGSSLTLQFGMADGVGCCRLSADIGQRTEGPNSLQGIPRTQGLIWTPRQQLLFILVRQGFSD